MADCEMLNLQLCSSLAYINRGAKLTHDVALLSSHEYYSLKFMQWLLPLLCDMRKLFLTKLASPFRCVL